MAKIVKDIKEKTGKIGAWSFLGGVILAIIIGLFGAQDWVYAILVILGIIVGFLNVTGKESQGFLLASVSLVIVSSMGKDIVSSTIPLLGNILTALSVLFVPATIVVALKSVFAIAKD